MVDAGRRLEESTLYKEDAFEEGHRAVWGSFYDAAAGRWGYACCRGTERRRPCERAVAAPARGGGGSASSSSRSEEEDEDEEIDERTGEKAAVRWRDIMSPPEEFLPKSSFEAQGAESYVAHFCRYVVEQWKKVIAGKRSLEEGNVEHQDEMVRRMFRSAEALHQTQDALAPLVKRCEDRKLIEHFRRLDKVEAEKLAKEAAANAGKRMRNSSTGRGDDTAPEMTLMDRLVHMVEQAYERDYAEANKHYIELTLGKKKWHNAYHGGEGKSNKGFKLHTVSMSAPNAFDVDETVNNYIRAFRRALLFCQMIRPNENVAKHM